jgi:8-oxo-dGTP pyrophosphatase MutT (NUDIX family)
MLLSTDSRMIDGLAHALAGALAARERTVLARPEKVAAAVLVPLLAVEDDPQLVYTRRASWLAHHQGQVAFPGGRYDAGTDTDLAATALREAHEEIGLDPSHVRLLGALDDIETMATQFVITPYVGLVPYPYDWVACPHEVDAIFSVPLRVLQAPDVERQELWDFDGRRVPIDLFPVAGHVIWGATHRITRNLLAVLRTLAS